MSTPCLILTIITERW